MQRAESRFFPPLWQLAVIALCLTLLSGTTYLLSVSSYHQGGVTILWPTNGFLIGVLLCTPRRQWSSCLAVGFLIDFIVNLHLGSHIGNALYLSSCNMLEVSIGAFGLYPVISPQPDLTQRRQLKRLMLVGVLLAPAVASFLASLGYLRKSGFSSFPGFLHFFQLWFTADALGNAVVIPLYLSFSRGEQFLGRSRKEIAGHFLLLGAVTFAIFWQTQLPFFFLVLTCLLVMGVRLGLAGSAIGLLIVATVGGFLTTAGHGPIALMHIQSLPLRDLALQCSIAVSMLVLYIAEVVIAERRRLQKNLETSETRFRLLAEVSRDVIVMIDLDGHRHYISPAVSEVLGWSQEELLGGSWRDVVHPDDSAAVAQLLRDCQEGKPTRTLDYRCRDREGEYRWVEVNPRLYRDSAGHPTGFVNIIRDVAERKAAEEELNKAFRTVENLASVDGLTGMANRRRFDEILEQEWLRAQRDQTPLSLLMIDVDHFKLYNDSYGHLAGDDCLRHVAQVMREFINRPADLPARYGGEEFAVILPDTDRQGALEIAGRMRLAIEHLGIPHADSPWGIVTFSTGVATLFPGQGEEHSFLVHAADGALYRAKRSGRNRVEVG
jgi:diguanylate cyclase (GGDEF)-like protein/PAS domain S-box-containing protein